MSLEFSASFPLIRKPPPSHTISTSGAEPQGWNLPICPISLQILHLLLMALHFSYHQPQTHQLQSRPTQTSWMPLLPLPLLPLPAHPAPRILAQKHQGLSQQKWLWGVG